MDKRSFELYQSYGRIAVLVEQQPALRTLAAESQAFPLFVGVVKQLLALADEGEANRLEGRALRDRIDALRNRLRTELTCIDVAFELAHRPEFEHQRQPRHDILMRYVFAAKAYVDIADRYRDILVGVGMHPRKIEDARRTIDELIEVHQHWTWVDLRRSTHVESVNIVLGLARTRKRQLENELAPALAHDAHSQQWKAALTLGRTHRTRALPAPNVRRLPAPPVPEAAVADRAPARDDHAPHERTTTSRRAIGGIFRSVVGRFAGDDGHARPEDVSVEETRRLGPGAPPAA